LDEYLRFLDGENKGNHSESILEVGVQKALSQVHWDEEGFRARGGLYDWSRSTEKTECGNGLDGIDMKELEF
jgi:radical S-adenosyl methionine domain-containing protein 2